MIDVACDWFDRRRRLHTARLPGEHGVDIPGPVVVRTIAADCTRMQAAQVGDVCGILLPQLSPLQVWGAPILSTAQFAQPVDADCVGEWCINACERSGIPAGRPPIPRTPPERLSGIGFFCFRKRLTSDMIISQFSKR